jgi:transcriptional regulator with XRE-family HTH domain
MALNLKQLRDYHGVSVEYLAKQTGIKKEVIEAIERGDISGVFAKDVALLGRYFKTTEIQDLTVF